MKTLVQVLGQLPNTRNASLSSMQNIAVPNNQSNCATNEFGRNQIRMDGFQIYAVVSALNLSSSIACLTAYVAIEQADQDNPRGFYNITYGFIADFLFTFSNAIGIMTGIHSTLIFSMVSMYGRSALGLNRDAAYYTFIEETLDNRQGAFRSFTWSIYSFLVQATCMIISRTPRWKWAIPGLLLLMVPWTLNQERAVLRKASKIFGTNVHFLSWRKLCCCCSSYNRVKTNDENNVVDSRV
eukprot:CAMPEP_0194203720 /NCGR_PEP_ID=MMETSP0156-20130528/3413_1 /TAXON_ID=33649 /ORGANISM="Thalassionema nitzschioides, Strain L26-B" /LENGTH=239 /DNA_ID=CAMNT_0038929521 /DNA_START=278 /DNA_END=997 /DNA_ORIENTATION=-